MRLMNKRLYALSCLFVSLLLFIACNTKKINPKPKEAPETQVDVLVASSQTLTNNIEVNGTVAANEYVELHPEASGRLIYLNVPEGRKLAAGTVIARVNDADLKAQLEKSRVLLDLAQKTEGRYKQLLAINGINQSDYETALNAVNGYKADIDYNQALLDKTVLKTPFEGVIGLRQVSLGAYVTPATLIATMQQLDRIKIDFTLPEEYADIIKVGGTVEVESLGAGQKNRKKALILAIEPQVNQASRNLTVRAILQNSSSNPGAFVKVYINAGINKKAVLIPTNSMIPDDKNNQVILVKNGKASFVNVSTGVRLSNNVEITKGINAGDTLVVTGVLFARPGGQLQIRHIRTLDQFAEINNNTN